MQTYKTYKGVAWGVIGLSVLAFGALVAVTGGFTEPYVSSPSSTVTTVGFGLAAAGLVGGLLALRFVEAWHWEAVGREVGLTPASTGLPRPELARDDDALIGKALLSGTVRGRAVRARVYTRSQDDGHDQGGRSATFTVVEADLEQRADEGVIVHSADGGLTDIAEGAPDAHDDWFAAFADDEAHAQALISGDAREALIAMEDFNHLFVGDARAVLHDAMPDVGDAVPDIGGFSVGSMVQSGLESMVGGLAIDGDAQTVTHRMEDALLDAGEMERQVEAVVTAAETFEQSRRDAASA